MDKSTSQSTILPWHREAAKEINKALLRQNPTVSAVIARHDPHAEQHATTLWLLREMVEDKTEGPFFHEDEHGPDSVLNRARAHLAAHRQTGGGK